ncbi:MAG: MATE family efflux transporter, partial [Holdemanella sp.]|nr:MATE family efflux transporter [Holdemanella sp.]
IGAKEDREARNIFIQAIFSVLIWVLIVMGIGLIISSYLPKWLHADPAIWDRSSGYLRIYCLFLPCFGLNQLACSALQSSGNMKLPSYANVCMCFLDVFFNYIFIFKMHMGVYGAALGTGCAMLTIMIFTLSYALLKSESLHLRKEKLQFSMRTFTNALKIGIPVGIEQVIMSGSQIVSTRIVAPLGTISMAAHSLAITAEGMCYMPGYGIASAATTLIGQSIGAKRKDLLNKFGWLTTGMGMAVMTGMGILLFFLSPLMMGLLTPDASIQALGTSVLKIEAFAEMMFAASIVANGVFRGAGDTFIPSILSFCSVWLVRLPLAYIFSKTYGLYGVWMAMVIELWVRGILFLIRLKRNKWQESFKM